MTSSNTPSTQNKLITKTHKNSLLSFLATSLSNFLNPPLPPYVDPKLVLTGNFIPVQELPPTECSIVEGELPSSLNGAYIRNGPNPLHQPTGPYHLFDGDGMLHCTRISRGKATFCSRYVKTHRYNLESEAGVSLIPNFLSGFYGSAHLLDCIIKVFTGQLSLAQGFGLANTNLVFFANKLFATHDADLPYVMRITKKGDIETMERYNFGGEVFLNMASHLKNDPETGEIFSFRCFPFFPYLTLYQFDSNGLIQQELAISSVNSPIYIHDFAITKNYVIVPDTQLELSLLNLMTCKGMPVISRPTKVPRIGVIPRNATSDSEMQWFLVPKFNTLHIINAWEDDDHESLVIVATVASNPLDFMDHIGRHSYHLCELKININTGKITNTILSIKRLELGSINPAYRGKKSRFIYMGVSESGPKMSGVVKIDLELGQEVASRSYGPSYFGGEALFVAQPTCHDEDEGYVMTYVHNEMSCESKFVVMDAKSPALDVVTSVKLPGRVPYGFHAIFLNEQQL
ncbi:9-cis-epoxycarotenoid dioxygenase, partial [Bertholletia excelsa]